MVVRAQATRQTVFVGVLGKQLSRHDFVCGQLSIADFAGGPPVVARKIQDIVVSDLPNSKARFERAGA